MWLISTFTAAVCDLKNAEWCSSFGLLNNNHVCQETPQRESSPLKGSDAAAAQNQTIQSAQHEVAVTFQAQKEKHLPANRWPSSSALWETLICFRPLTGEFIKGGLLKQDYRFIIKELDSVLCPEKPNTGSDMFHFSLKMIFITRQNKKHFLQPNQYGL